MVNVTLDNTMGALLIGVVVSSCLLGCTGVQTWYYYRNYKDPPYVRLAVGAVLILEVVHVAFGTHMVYYWLVTHYAQPLYLLRAPWTGYAGPGVIALTISAVLLFYAHRVYQVSGKKVWLASLIIVLAIAHAVLTWTNIVTNLKLPNVLAIEGPTRWYGTAALSLGVTVDTIIAGSLSYYLYTRKTGIERTDAMVDRLLAYVLNNGMLTGLVNTLALIFINIQPNTAIYLAIIQVVGSCYANAFLATLNARASTRKNGVADSQVVVMSTLKFNQAPRQASIIPQHLDELENFSQDTQEANSGTRMPCENQVV